MCLVFFIILIFDIQNPGASDSKKLESCRTLEELDQMIATQVYSNMEGSVTDAKIQGAWEPKRPESRCEMLSGRCKMLSGSQAVFID